MFSCFIFFTCKTEECDQIAWNNVFSCIRHHFGNDGKQFFSYFLLRKNTSQVFHLHLQESFWINRVEQMFRSKGVN